MSNVKVGQVGRASISSAHALTDPRVRRNFQQQTNDRDIGPGLKIDENGKLTGKVGGLIRIRGGTFEVDTEEMLKTIGAVLDFPLKFKKGRINVEPARRIIPIDTTLVPSALDVATKVNELLAALKSAKLMEG